MADTASAREATVSGARMAIAACFGSPVIMNIVSIGLSFSLRLLTTDFVPITYEPISRLARLGFVLFYTTVCSHLLVFPMCGYRAPTAYALYLFAIYACLLTFSCVIELSHQKHLDNPPFNGEWLCEGAFLRFLGPCHSDC